MSAMRKVATIGLAGQIFDLALGMKRKPVRDTFDPIEMEDQPRAALARETVDLYGRPVALEVDLESELAAIGNVAFVEALLTYLALTIQERDAALAAARRAEP